MADIIDIKPRLMDVLSDQPVTRGGVHFEEYCRVAKADPVLAADLSKRGLVWLTQWGETETRYGYGGSVIAATWEQAQEIATARGLGEVIVGQQVERIPG